MSRLPPGSTRTAPLFPYATLFRARDHPGDRARPLRPARFAAPAAEHPGGGAGDAGAHHRQPLRRPQAGDAVEGLPEGPRAQGGPGAARRSEEHTSELQSLMRISYAVFCLKKKTIKINTSHNKT